MTYRLTHTDTEARLTLTGTLTSSDHDWFKAGIDAAFACAPPVILLDLAGITRIDSSGLRMLVILRDEGLRRGVPLALINPSTAIERLLELVDFPALFEIRHDV